MQGGRLRPRNLESLQENEVYNATGQDEGEQGSTGVTYYTTTGLLKTGTCPSSYKLHYNIYYLKSNTRFLLVHLYDVHI